MSFERHTYLLAKRVRRFLRCLRRHFRWITKRSYERSWVLLSVYNVFRWIDHITAGYWIRVAYTKKSKRYHVVDTYVIVYCLISIVILAVLPILASNCWFTTISQIILWWRLLDIFQGWVNVTLLRRHLSVYSPSRMLFLDFVSFTTVAIIFGSFAFLWRYFFSPPFCSPWQSLYYSVGTITTIGSTYTPIGRGYFLFYGEIIFSLLFLVIVIRRVISFFPRTSATKPPSIG